MTFNDSIIQSLYPLTSPRLISWSQPAWEPGFEAIWMWHVILGLGMFFCVVSGSHWDPDMPWPRKRAKLKELTWQPAQFTYFAVFLFRSHPPCSCWSLLVQRNRETGLFSPYSKRLKCSHIDMTHFSVSWNAYMSGLEFQYTLSQWLFSCHFDAFRGFAPKSRKVTIWLHKGSIDAFQSDLDTRKVTSYNTCNSYAQKVCFPVNMKRVHSGAVTDIMVLMYCAFVWHPL